MAISSTSDVAVLVLGVGLAALFLFRDQIFSGSGAKTVAPPVKQQNGGGDPRNFIEKMKAGVRRPFRRRPITHSLTVHALFSPTEEAPRHLLRFANGYGGGVRHSHRQGGKVKVRSRLPRLRS